MSLQVFFLQVGMYVFVLILSLIIKTTLLKKKIYTYISYIMMFSLLQVSLMRTFSLVTNISILTYVSELSKYERSFFQYGVIKQIGKSLLRVLQIFGVDTLLKSYLFCLEELTKMQVMQHKALSQMFLQKFFLSYLLTTCIIQEAKNYLVAFFFRNFKLS